MSKALGKRCVWGLCGVLASVLIVAATARAEVSTDLSGTVLVYPKVMYTEGRDTVIQIANTSNLTVHVWCFYVNGEPEVPGLPGPSNPRRCQVTDFQLWLSRQQPTHWVASQGRMVNPLDSCFNDPNGNCDGAGIDPGAIPPVPEGFEGELKCVQVDTGGTPFPGNALKGEAVLRDLTNGDVSKYNAVAILASGAVSDDNKIQLNNTPDTSDGEANSCYANLYLNHFAAGTSDPVIEAINPDSCTGGDCPIDTELTMVPCSEDLENLIFPSVTVQFLITNEFENTLSFSTTIQCWFNESLLKLGSATGNSPFSEAMLGSTAAFTSIKPVGEGGGVIGVAEEKHANDTKVTAKAAWDLQAEGDFVSGRFLPKTRYDAALEENGVPVVDTIVIPEGF
jgi:hypothetical protein